ncbi:MAG TPA: hypothetical protein VNS81_09780 [Nocardioides sp.]|nr:hypothetical protein [Nocardioides sp.]
MTKRPAAVELASWLLWFLVAAGLVVCVLVVVYRHDLGAVWSPIQDDDSTIQPVEFVPVILVLYGVVAILAASLIPLFRLGHNWARHGLAAIVVGVILVTVATVRTAPPTMVKWSAIAAAVISAVTLVFIWHPQSRHFVREAAYEPEERERRAADRAGGTGLPAAAATPAEREDAPGS